MALKGPSGCLIGRVMPALTGLLVLASPAWANMTPRHSALPFLAMGFWAWLLVGMILKRRSPGLIALNPSFGGCGVALLLFFGGGLDVVVEGVLFFTGFWTIYLIVLVVGLLFNLHGEPPARRRLNLLFHGASLVAIFTACLAGQVPMLYDIFRNWNPAFPNQVAAYRWWFFDHWYPFALFYLVVFGIMALILWRRSPPSPTPSPSASANP